MSFRKKCFVRRLRSALTVKLRDSELSVVDAFSLGSHRTKPFVETLDKLGFKRKVLLVDHEENQNLHMASRNLVRGSLDRKPSSDSISAFELSARDLHEGRDPEAFKRFW